MTRSRGEPPRGLIDRQWPYQVALPRDQCTGQNLERPHEFCRGLKVYSLHPAVNDGHQEYLVCCFAEPEDALQFKEAFSGISFYPEDRKGRNWKPPPGDIRRQPKRDPYDWK